MTNLSKDDVGDWDVLGPSTELRIWNADPDQGDEGAVLTLGPMGAVKVIIGVPRKRRRGKRHVELIFGELAILKGDLLIELPEQELLKLESDLCVPISDELCVIKGEVDRTWVQDLIKESVNLGMSPEKYLELLKEIRKDKEKKTVDN